MSIFDKAVQAIDKSDEIIAQTHPFYAFEPWDVGPREEWIKEQAREDGIDLYAPEYMKHIGLDPHHFQSGFILSKKHNPNLLAASQDGKSLAATIKLLIMASGEIPISLRYPAGTDTNVKRQVTHANIQRFGRVSKDNGKIIDFNPRAERDGSWDCGTIKAVGVFPQELIAPPSSLFRIGTLQRVKLEVWWPRLIERKDRIMPDHFLDRTRGNDGCNKKDGLIYLGRDCTLSILTYEMDEQKFEGPRAWLTLLDEEPPKDKFISTVVTHTVYWSLVETPYKGITFTKKIFFPDKISPDSQTFHATAYDCPYKTLESINRERSKMPLWEIGARIWGMPTELRGAPYFDRKKIMLWMQRYTAIMPFKWGRFEPKGFWFGIRSKPEITRHPGLLDTPVELTYVDANNDQTTWRIYEERQPGVPYIFSGDPAEGALIPEEAGDISAGMVVRPANVEKDEKRPVIVATIRSTLETIPFARTCSYGMRYYNNSLFAPEIRGSASATFANELQDWPYWYMHTNTQDSTGKQREKKGFDTTTRVRDIIFDLIKEWLLDFDEDQYPYIPDEPLLLELAAAVVGKTPSGKQRCDHPPTGTLDTTIAFGIILYVFKYCSDQIRCNYVEPKKEKAHRREPIPKKPMPCNLSFIGYGGKNG